MQRCDSAEVGDLGLNLGMHGYDIRLRCQEVVAHVTENDNDQIYMRFYL